MAEITDQSATSGMLLQSQNSAKPTVTARSRSLPCRLHLRLRHSLNHLQLSHLHQVPCLQLSLSRALVKVFGFSRLKDSLKWFSEIKRQHKEQ
jgi:hypothetical protein